MEVKYDWNLFNVHNFHKLKSALISPANSIDFTTAIGSVRIGLVNINIQPEHLLENEDIIVAGFSMFYPHDSMDLNPPYGQDIQGMPYDYADKQFFSLSYELLKDMKYKDFTGMIEKMLTLNINEDEKIKGYACTNGDFWTKYDRINITPKIAGIKSSGKAITDSKDGKIPI